MFRTGDHFCFSGYTFTIGSFACGDVFDEMPWQAQLVMMKRGSFEIMLVNLGTERFDTQQEALCYAHAVGNMIAEGGFELAREKRTSF